MPAGQSGARLPHESKVSAATVRRGPGNEATYLLVAVVAAVLLHVLAFVIFWFWQWAMMVYESQRPPGPVIELSDEHRNIAKIVGKDGLNVPRSAAEEVSNAIAGVSSFVTVHSAIVGKSEDIELVEADPNIYVHLLPSGPGFILEMFVKPLGKGG